MGTKVSPAVSENVHKAYMTNGCLDWPGIWVKSLPILIAIFGRGGGSREENRFCLGPVPRPLMCY
jgi:hypothetical protein